MIWEKPWDKITQAYKDIFVINAEMLFSQSFSTSADNIGALAFTHIMNKVIWNGTSELCFMPYTSHIDI